MKYIDGFLDRITMYRLLLYYLVIILCAAMLFGALGVIAYSPYVIAGATVLIVGVCFVTNFIFSKIYNAPTNTESSILTGLILSLIITPPASIHEAPFLIAAAGLAIASKYIIAIHNKHIFNPVAIAVVLTAFGPQQSASWWVGSVTLLPFVIIGGLLVVRKIRRTRMVSLFFIVALASTIIVALLGGKDVGTTIQATLLHSSLFFLGFVMLTEPLTSPTTIAKRRWYAGIVGICFAPGLNLFGIYSTPELALVIGNIASFLMSPRVKTRIQLTERHPYGTHTEDLVFTAEKKFTYKPGQYIEMTLPHHHVDSRGLRRYFTLASSPTEDTIRLGVRFYDDGSSFKKLLKTVQSNMFASLGQLGGDFILPKDNTRKLAFIAGGIGITPFRSMVKYLSDTHDARSVTLLYGERSVDDITYQEVFEQARAKGNIQSVYMVGDAPAKEIPHVRTGRIDSQSVNELIPDYRDRLFYISGPQLMVKTTRSILIDMGVKRRNIKTDFFSGYAS